MEEFAKHGVYRKIILKNVGRNGERPIGVRWVDINKGDHVNQNTYQY